MKVCDLENYHILHGFGNKDLWDLIYMDILDSTSIIYIYGEIMCTIYIYYHPLLNQPKSERWCGSCLNASRALEDWNEFFPLPSVLRCLRCTGPMDRHSVYSMVYYDDEPSNRKYFVNFILDFQAFNLFVSWTSSMMQSVICFIQLSFFSLIVHCPWLLYFY